jgi:hypothetical protein
MFKLKHQSSPVFRLRCTIGEPGFQDFRLGLETYSPESHICKYQNGNYQPP